jgi:hypothetical protein
MGGGEGKGSGVAAMSGRRSILDVGSFRAHEAPRAVDASRRSRRQIARQQRDRRQQGRRRDHADGIGHADTKQHAFHEAADEQRRRDADQHTGDDQRHALFDDQSEDCRLARAERHAQPDLALSLNHGIREGSVEADAGEPERQQAEDREERDANLGLEQASVDDLASGPDAADRNVWRGCMNLALDGHENLFRIGRAPHVERHRIRIVLLEWDVDARLRRLGPARIVGGARDPDDLPHLLLSGQPHASSDRVSVGPIVARHLLVHDGNGRRVLSIEIAERTPPANCHAGRFEVAAIDGVNDRRNRVRARSFLPPFHLDPRHLSRPERHVGGPRGGFDASNPGHALASLLVERLRLRLRVPRLPRAGHEDREVRALEARVDIVGSLNTAHHVEKSSITGPDLVSETRAWWRGCTTRRRPASP